MKKMTVYFLSLIIIFIVTVICPSDSLFCRNGQRFSLCGNHKCQPTCEHPQGPKNCKPICKPGCVCNSGLVRRETDKKCVPIEECSKNDPEGEPQKPSRRPDKKPSRPPDKEPSKLPDKEPSKKKSKEPSKKESKEPSRMYLLRKKESKEPGNSLSCPSGERFSECANPECQPTCDHLQFPYNCKSTCKPGCVCMNLQVRRETDKKCVPIEECSEKRSEGKPQKPSRQPDKEPGRRPDKEPSRRPDKKPSRQPNKEPSRRPDKEPSKKKSKEPSKKESKEPSRMYQLRKKEIKEPGNSLSCHNGERFSLCGNPECQRTCEHPQFPKSCKPVCKPGCVCKSVLVRRETDKKCVPIEECPKERPEVKPQKPSRRPDKEPSKKKSKEPSKKESKEPSRMYHLHSRCS